jgi:hypothetical protein
MTIIFKTGEIQRVTQIQSNNISSVTLSSFHQLSKKCFTPHVCPPFPKILVAFTAILYTLLAFTFIYWRYKPDVAITLQIPHCSHKLFSLYFVKYLAYQKMFQINFLHLNPVTSNLNAPLHTQKYDWLPFFYTFYAVKSFHNIHESASEAGDFEIMCFYCSQICSWETSMNTEWNTSTYMDDNVQWPELVKRF